MTVPSRVITGRCHCGNLELALETRLAPTALAIRACSCGFCTRHGARTTSDPDGRVRITVHDPAHLLRYRFGLRTADFLVCRRCGVYLAAVMARGDRRYATLNTTTFDQAPDTLPASQAVDYGGESAAPRRARRQAGWTPAELVIETSA